jgi:hypothetical protein
MFTWPSATDAPFHNDVRCAPTMTSFRSGDYVRILIPESEMPAQRLSVYHGCVAIVACRTYRDCDYHYRLFIDGMSNARGCTFDLLTFKRTWLRPASGAETNAMPRARRYWMRLVQSIFFAPLSRLDETETCYMCGDDARTHAKCCRAAIHLSCVLEYTTRYGLCAQCPCRCGKNILNAYTKA